MVRPKKLNGFILPKCTAGSHRFVGKLIEQENHATVMGKDCKTGYHVVSAFNLVKIVTPCSISFGIFAGPWWDSEIERKPYQSIIASTKQNSM